MVDFIAGSIESRLLHGVALQPIHYRKHALDETRSKSFRTPLQFDSAHNEIVLIFSEVDQDKRSALDFIVNRCNSMMVITALNYKVNQISGSMNWKWRAGLVRYEYV
ncbi:hypothetical protein KIN20_024769 [Parelaphostrongylus tenuis]|uniref:Uncharacterized protein n=1 Tax=Parelaphostrongylus tenuis TaxID=148309 RepID=A0AAD5NBE4_PARTN|nr:hypothetical protein KIN20_024769 [Parelaphostrongylus tenuis]